MLNFPIIPINGRVFNNFTWDGTKWVLNAPTVTFASPTGIVKLTSSNGVTSGVMKSDSAPMISQDISPVWTGKHVFNGGVQILGTQTNDNATAGCIGEYIESQTGTTVALTNGIAINVTSISLTAGDWMVGAACTMTAASGTIIQAINASVSLTSAVIDATVASRTTIHPFAQGTALGLLTAPIVSVGPARFLLAATATVYLNLRVVFTSSTSNSAANTHLWARRMR